MTKLELVKKMVEFHENYYSKYHETKVEYYKYRGEVKTRTTSVLTKEGEELLELSYKDKLFKCPCCGEMVAFGELEYWDESVEDVMNDEITCSACYEDEMGEDL